jgi:FOP N terminal dimerisation domain
MELWLTEWLNFQKIPTKTQLQDYLSSTEGQVVASLVKEFLDFYGLGYADGFFQPVASCGVDFFVSPREELEKQLGISDENGETRCL